MNKGRFIPFLLLGLGTLTGVLVGFVAVQIFNGNKEDSSNSGTQNVPTLDQESIEEQFDPASDGTEATSSISEISDLIDTLESKNPINQLSKLYDIVDDTAADDIENMLKQSMQIPQTKLLQEVQKVLFQRLVKYDVNRALSLVVEFQDLQQTSFVGLVFQEWSLQDIDQAVIGVSDLKESIQQAAVTGILMARSSLSNNELLQIGRKLGKEEFIEDHIALKILDEDIIEPHLAWSRFIEEFGINTTTLSSVQQEVLMDITLARSEAENLSLQEILDELETSNYRNSFVSGILVRVGLNEPERALKIAESLELRKRDVFSRIVERAAQQKPIETLKATNVVSSLKTRAHLQRIVIRNWIATDPLEVLDALEQLPEDLREGIRSEALLALANESPETAKSYLQAVDDIVSKANVQKAIAYSLAKNDPDTALDWARSIDEVNQLGNELQKSVIQSIAEEDPSLAMELALELPIDSNTAVGLESVVIEEMVKQNIDEAILALGQTRNQSTKETAYLAVGDALIGKGLSESAIELVSESSPDFQFNYFASFTNTWAYEDPGDLFDKLPSLPSEKIQEHLAAALVTFNSVTQVLDAEQKSALKKYVPEVLHGLLQ